MKLIFIVYSLFTKILGNVILKNCQSCLNEIKFFCYFYVKKECLRVNLTPSNLRLCVIGKFLKCCKTFLLFKNPLSFSFMLSFNP